MHDCNQRPFAAGLATLTLMAAGCGGAPGAAEPEAPSPVADALARADATVLEIIAVPEAQRSDENTLGRLDEMLANLELDTNMTAFLGYVSTDPEVRDIGNKAEEDVANWRIDLLKNERLYAAIKSFADTKPPLAGERKRQLEHTLRDFRRGGMALDAADRDKLAGIEKEISKLAIEFEKNIREDASVVPLTRQELSGLAEDYFQSTDLKRSGDLYLVGLSYPQFLPVQDHCTNATTREKTWVAYKRRGGARNVALLEKILVLRAQAASILGYDHAADFETEIRMAKSADTVQAFYQELRPLVRRKAQQDYDELVALKCRDTGDPSARLEPWDTSYYTNVLKKEKYAVDVEVVREYFPLQAAIDGLFSITQSLYGLEYRDVTEEAGSRDRPLWHDEVRLYEVWDTKRGEVLGEFYLDLHPREGKYSHAAQWGLAQHKVWPDKKVTKPVAALVCNFTKPTPDKPSLLTHDEVETFFHEFGHCLHTILSDAQLYSFAGTSVERDFVEAPSQMFENWVWDPDVLKTFARHYKTGEPFPDALLVGMIAARNMGSGMAAERQFYYGLFDLRCHLDPAGKLDTTQLAMDLWDPKKDGVELYEPVPETYFQASFGHLMGYQAGYYGYQWSLVYACDMFQRFKELGMLSPAAGMYYREKILSRGGTADGLDLVKDYLGREPSKEAYLKHLGLE